MATTGFSPPASPPSKLPSLVQDWKRIHKETGSPFDMTPMKHSLVFPPGVHERTLTTPHPGAFSLAGSRPQTARPDPRLYLTRHSGFGGAAATVHRDVSSSSLRPATSPLLLSRVAPSSGGFGVSGTAVLPSSPLRASASSASVAGAGATAALMGPPSSGAKSPRRNPPNTELRRFYERGDLPCVLDSKGARNRLVWRVPFDKLDYAHYLPLFFAGLREEELPYKFIALQGLRDLIDHGGNRLLPLVPHLIIPLRQALNTRRHAVMVAAMDAIKQLLVTDLHAPDGPMMAKAFVPYFRQLLPIFNIFILNNYNLGDKTHYGQRRNDVLGDRIEELLMLFETYGGEDAFINIKYLIPTYQSCMTAPK